jgi:hypothetical protein
MVIRGLLDDQGSSRTVSRSRAAYMRITFILASMAHQLGSGAASAEKSAASVLASMAVLFRDLISLAHTLASAAESQESPSSKENVAHHSNGSHPDGNLFWVVGHGSEVHSYAEDKVRSHEQQNRQEGVIGSVKRARNTAPGQLHSANDLGHCNLRAAG